jgi:hypothetical protein
MLTTMKKKTKKKERFYKHERQNITTFRKPPNAHEYNIRQFLKKCLWEADEGNDEKKTYAHIYI